jgi:DedD protein
MKTYEESEELSHSDTEITLGTRSILGIFFGLVLLCGVFFGFGYSLGRGNPGKSAPPAETISNPPGETSPQAVKTVVEEPNASGNNPYTGTTTSDGSINKPAPTVLQSNPPAAVPAVPQALNTANASPQSMNSANAPQAAKAAYSVPAPAGAAPAGSPASASTAPAAAIMVQIAAVSHSQDADVLVSALDKLGYNASVRSGAADQLLHVQIGPFTTRDAANAMRTKLLNDGYNAILK